MSGFNDHGSSDIQARNIRALPFKRLCARVPVNLLQMLGSLATETTQTIQVHSWTLLSVQYFWQKRRFIYYAFVNKWLNRKIPTAFLRGGLCDLYQKNIKKIIEW